MSEASVDYRIGLLEDLADPAEAAAYLNAALEDGDQQVFLLALRDVAEARGMSQVAGRLASIARICIGCSPPRETRKNPNNHV